MKIRACYVVGIAVLMLTDSAVFASEEKRPAPVNLADIEPVATIAQAPLSGLIRSGPDPARASVFSEDFQGEVMPAGWMLIDNDGLTPHADLPLSFTEAWIVAEDPRDVGNFVAMSTSWYDPAATADDWMITPDIPLVGGTKLTWRGEALDPVYPDGYNVYVSTTGQSMAGCVANPTLFSIAAESGAEWTDREASLSGYSGETVNICFQNNSPDQYILMIDDISVVEILNYDAAVVGADAPSEYSRVPLPLGYLLALGGTVENIGFLEVTNVVLTATVLQDDVPVHTEVSTPLASLSPDTSQAVDLPDYMPIGLGNFTVSYTVTIAETDEDPGNNTGSTALGLLVTGTELARDDNVKTGFLGIGEGTPGELGTHFTLPVGARLESASFLVGPFTPPDIVGDSISVNLRSMNAGVPDVILATSESYTFVDYDERTLNLSFQPPIDLPAGDFMLGVIEEDSRIELGYAADVFTLGTNWVNFVGSPSGWANNETWGYNVTYILRAVFAEPQLTVTKDGTASGLVISVPAGINCGQTCASAFEFNETVTLVPIPDTGAVFAGWSGDADCSDSQVTMSNDVSCTATFNLATHTLTADTTGGGTGVVTSSPPGINCGSDCTEIYYHGTVVDLTPTPDPGSIFLGWSGHPDCTDGQVTISEDILCSGQFELGIFADGFESGDTTAWSTAVP